MRFFQINLKFNPIDPWSEILIAFLSELNFDSFEETEIGLKAFIDENQFSEDAFQKVLSRIELDVEYEIQSLKNENWNSKWESSFEPVIIDDQCGVRASFHPSLNVKHEIVITPKMSFGTGHHSTTYGMMKKMLDLNFNSKKVLDMGCGTAVLAILASKLGANKVLAIDIDEWAFKNSIENIKINELDNIKIIQGGSSLIKETYDIILANINRNVLLNDMAKYSRALGDNGNLLLSGFYQEDLPLITNKCKQFGLEYKNNTHHNNWVTAHFQKKL